MDFFIQLHNAWLQFTNSNFPIPTYIEGILEESIFLKPHVKLGFTYDNPYFYSIAPRDISQKFTII